MRFVSTKVIPLFLVGGSVAVAAPMEIVESLLDPCNPLLEGTVAIARGASALAISHREVQSDGKVQIEIDTEYTAALHSVADEHASIERSIRRTGVASVVDKPATSVAAAEFRLVEDSAALPEGSRS